MIRRMFLAAMFVLAMSQSAFAQDPGDSRATEFVAMQGPARETVPGGTLLVSAYGLVWFFLLAYVARVGLLAARTGREVTALEQRISGKKD